MQRFNQALGISLVLTLFLMCFAFAANVGYAVAYGQNVVQAAINTVVAGLFLFCLLAYVFHEFYRYIDERNRILDEELKEQQKRKQEREKTDQSRPD